jgi:hypothetical protein
MQFHLRTLLLLFVILWSSLAACGLIGIGVTVVIILVAIAIDTQRLTVGEWLAIGVIAMVLIGLLLPAISTGLTPENSRHLCTLRLRELANALLAYHEKHGSFPPAYVADAMGRPVRSWRVEMLPYLGATALYEQYDRTEPWNDSRNSAVSYKDCYSRRRGGHDLVCPSEDPASPNNADFTSYFAVVGPKTAWRGSMPTKLGDLPDRGRRMILLAESADRGINWKEPKDLTYDEAVSGVCRPSGSCISSPHAIGDDYFHNTRRGAYVAFVDGSVHFLPEDIRSEDLKALLTGDSTRPIDLGLLARPTLNWSHIVALAVLIVSTALLIISTLVQRLRRRPEQQDTENGHKQRQADSQQ